MQRCHVRRAGNHLCHLRPQIERMRNENNRHVGSYALARCCGDDYRFCVLSDERLGPEQIQALRRMSPAKRWRTAHRLYWTMRRHKTAFLRAQHPDWSDQHIGEQVRRLFQHAGT